MPNAAIMYPNWDMVEYANTRLTSFCPMAIVAANNAVNAPMLAMMVMVGLSVSPGCHPAEINGKKRITIYTPADTIVAAWIMAETGVGPSMASGSQTCSGN